MAATRSKWQRHVQNGGDTVKMAATQLKWRRHGQNGSATFKMAGTRSKWRRHGENGGDTVKMAATIWRTLNQLYKVIIFQKVIFFIKTRNNYGFVIK